MRLIPVLLILLVACGEAGDTSGATALSTTPSNDRTIPEGSLPKPLDHEGEPTPVTGEVPRDLLQAIRDDAAQRTGLPAEDFVEIRSQEIVWNDGSLGCGEPGKMYTQALVDGFWVVLEVGDAHLDYRVGSKATFMLCEQASTGV